MLPMRAVSTSVRFAWAALLALLLALRTIGGAGYMPALDHGRPSIMICPGADLDAPLSLGTMHHHGRMQHKHATCPYAAAAALGALTNDWVPLLAAVLLAVVPLLGRTFLFLDLQSRRERPPAIGPPVPA